MINYLKGKCTKQNLVKILILFIILQPLLDIYILFDEKIISIFKISPSTVIRLLFVSILGVCSLFVIKSKKQWKLYSLYIALVIIYSIIHFWNANQFVSLTPGNFYYSFSTELFYIIRLLIPLFIIIISSNINFNTATINRVVNIIVILISGTIFFSNLLKISIGAYATKIIRYNIIDWFTQNIYAGHTFYDTATRGYFSFANMISSLLFGLTAFLFYQLFKRFNYKYVILIIIQMLAMFMLGTKVATFGFLLSSILMLFVYLFFVVIKKELIFNYKIIIFIAIIVFSWIAIYPYSPCKNRIAGVEIMESEVNENDKKSNFIKIDELNNRITNKTNTLTEEEKKKMMSEFIAKNYKNFALKEEYVLKKYPYQYDPYFWYSLMPSPYDKKTDNRFLVSSILDRLKELNNRKTIDDLFGLTYSRMSNISVLERDFLAHYYTLGIVGFILLIMPYILIVLISIIFIIINFKNHTFELKNICYIICLFSGLSGAYYCGNVLDNLTFTIIFAFLYGQLIQNIFVKKEKKSVNENEVTILALHLGVGGVEKYLSSLCKMLKDNYKIKIISTYKVMDNPAFDFDDVEIEYLINDKPRKAEMIDSLKNKKIFAFIKYLFINIKLYILKYIKNVEAVKGINSKYVITTRIFHNNIVNVELDRSHVKIATEHNYHNNDNRYIDRVVSSINNFDYFVCVSEELKEFYEKKVVNPKVVYIPNTIDYTPNVNNKKINMNIISVGRFSKEKGFIDLIEVFSLIHTKNSKTRLTLVGDGVELDNIKAKIKELNLNDCIDLPGFINDSKVLNKYYQKSSIYLMTSFTESFGIVLIEAMSNGIVCAAFDSANGAKTLLNDNGILVSNRDKEKLANEVLSILCNEEKWKKMSERSHNYAKAFDIKEVSKKWLKLLGECK